jgi:hypothetical protein
MTPFCGLLLGVSLNSKDGGSNALADNIQDKAQSPSHHESLAGRGVPSRLSARFELA